jgi:hypothetical protein
MKDLNLNKEQSDALALIDLILEITDEMSSTPSDVIGPGQARDWTNKLSSYLCRLGSLEADFEYQFHRIMSNERNESKSNADAKTRAEATPQYLVYKKIKNFRQDLYEKIQSSKRLISEEPDGRKDDRKSERN